MKITLAGKPDSTPEVTKMDNVLTLAPNSATGFKLRVAGGIDAAGLARKQLSRLRADLDPPVVENVRLLVTELVTNAIRHAEAGTIEIAVIVSRQRVRVEVSNRGLQFDARPRNDGSPVGGWGLFLVDRLSDDWGVVDGGGRQRVWFELAR